jgi:hypothetical protein
MTLDVVEAWRTIRRIGFLDTPLSVYAQLIGPIAIVGAISISRRLYETVVLEERLQALEQATK